MRAHTPGEQGGLRIKFPVEPEAGIDDRGAIECLEKDVHPLPVSMRSAAASNFVSHARSRIEGSRRSGIGTIVVVQDIEHCAVEISRLRADVVAGPAIDLVEQFFLGEFGIRLRRADSTKQGGLAIVEAKP